MLRTTYSSDIGQTGSDQYFHSRENDFVQKWENAQISIEFLYNKSIILRFAWRLNRKRPLWSLIIVYTFFFHHRNAITKHFVYWDINNPYPRPFCSKLLKKYIKFNEYSILSKIRINLRKYQNMQFRQQILQCKENYAIPRQLQIPQDDKPNDQCSFRELKIIIFKMKFLQRDSSSKRPYAKISIKKREQLVKNVMDEGLPISKIAKKLRIKISTARLIIRKYKEYGQFYAKIFKTRPPRLNPKSQASQYLKSSNENPGRNDQQQQSISKQHQIAPIQDKGQQQIIYPSHVYIYYIPSWHASPIYF